VKAVFTDLLKPYPAEITQLDQQLVLLEGSHYFLSPYQTTSQKSVFKLASSNIESFTKLSPHSTRGGSLHFGPYQNVASFSVRDLWLFPFILLNFFFSLFSLPFLFHVFLFFW
jgi:oligosaccharyltransferase complex subunit alpha (ribophorin I)